MSAAPDNSTGLSLPPGETISQMLARFIRECDLSALPEAVSGRAKLYAIDTAAVALAGADARSSQILAELTRALGGREDCCVIGWPFRTSVVSAALVNGTIAHAIELDDDHRTSVLHPGTVVVPAALAAAEHAGAS